MGYWVKLVVSVSLICVFLRTLIGSPCIVPSDSMSPTILPGDRMWIDQTTYGAQLSQNNFTKNIVRFSYLVRSWTENEKLINTDTYRVAGIRNPEIGDLIVFNHPYDRILVVKRIAEILKKGDSVLITYKNFTTFESLAKREGLDIFKRGKTIFINNRIDSIFTLKQSYYYVLGDNQSNSLDSKVYGYIPHSSIVGRFNRVLYSLAPDEPFWKKLRWNRIMKSIE